MYYLIIFISLSALAIGCSFPIAVQNNISTTQILCDYLAFTTFAGVMCGVTLIIARPLTKKFFNPNSKLLHVSKTEINFYKKIKLEQWKDIVPDFGKLVGFKKKIDFSQSKNSKFYERFLYENVNAEILHGFDILLSPIAFCFLNPKFYPTIGLCGMAMVFILNIFPVILQRYLRPRLQRLYLLTKSHEEKLDSNLQSAKA